MGSVITHAGRAGRNDRRPAVPGTAYIRQSTAAGTRWRGLWELTALGRIPAHSHGRLGGVAKNQDRQPRRLRNLTTEARGHHQAMMLPH